MEEVNGLFLANADDGTIDDAIAKLPYNPTGYTLLLSTKERADAKKALLKVSECDEDLHPLLRDISYLFFGMLPSETEKFLLDRREDKQSALSIILAKSIKSITYWISLNKESLNSYEEAIKHYRKLNSNKNENISDECIIEKEFINAATDNLDRKKRKKIISGFKAINHYDKIYQLLDYDNTLQGKSDFAREQLLFHVTMLMVSLVKFSTDEIFFHGLQSMQNRRNKKGKDKAGLVSLRDDFSSRYPKTSRQKLWNIICSQLIKKRSLEYGEYSIKYIPKLEQDQKYSGHHEQTKDGEMEKVKISFTSFKKKKFWVSS